MTYCVLRNAMACVPEASRTGDPSRENGRLLEAAQVARCSSKTHDCDKLMGSQCIASRDGGIDQRFKAILTRSQNGERMHCVQLMVVTGAARRSRTYNNAHSRGH